MANKLILVSLVLIFLYHSVARILSELHRPKQMYMKRWLIIIGILFVLSAGLSSCAVEAYPSSGYYYSGYPYYWGYPWAWHGAYRGYHNWRGGGGAHYGARGGGYRGGGGYHGGGGRR